MNKIHLGRRIKDPFLRTLVWLAFEFAKDIRAELHALRHIR